MTRERTAGGVPPDGEAPRVAAALRRRAAPLLTLPLLALLASCQVVDLGRSCLPIQAPATVRLVRDVPAVWGIDADLRLDPPAPSRIDPRVPAGTTLRVERITQRVQFDSSYPDIEVSGRLADGRTFLYRWGSGQHYRRAPWEPMSVPDLRLAGCART